MKRRNVSVLPEAQNDLLVLYDQSAEAAGDRIALDYAERVKNYCEKLDLASERGHRRGDITPAYESSAFADASPSRSPSRRNSCWSQEIFYGGRNWEAELSDE